VNRSRIIRESQLTQPSDWSRRKNTSMFREFSKHRNDFPDRRKKKGKPEKDKSEISRRDAGALKRKLRESQLRLNLSAAATIGFAQSGVCLRLRGFSIFPRSMCNTNFGLGVLPAAGSASTLLS